jgi:N-acetylglucosamine-6-phosphate deacetylase
MIQPGFVDLQVNGYQGVDFSSPQLTLESVIETCRKLYNHGTTAFLPTMITAPLETYTQNLPVFARALEVSRDEESLAQILGIHLEGPYISPQDGARGVHPLENIRPPSIAEFKHFIELSNGSIKFLTLAPEQQGALSLIQLAVSLGIQVGIGHTLATSKEIEAAIQAGARFSTHLGNGLPMNIHRHHNPLWCQLSNPSLAAMIIADGHHLPVDFVNVVVQCKGLDKVIVVSDASPAAGFPSGEYKFFGASVRLEDNGRLSDPRTGYLAGSSALLKDCAAWLSSIGFDETSVHKLCRENALNAL